MWEGHTVKLWFGIGFSPLTYLDFLAVKAELTSGIVIVKSLRYCIVFSVHCMLLHTVSLIPGESMLSTINLRLYKVLGSHNNFRKVFIRLIL